MKDANVILKSLVSAQINRVDITIFKVCGRSLISSATVLNKAEVEEKIAGTFSLGVFWKGPLGMGNRSRSLKTISRHLGFSEISV